MTKKKKIRIATLTRRRPFAGKDEGPFVVSTEKHTGDANHAWRAILADKLHVWDTGPGKIEVVAGWQPAAIRRRIVAALEGAGFVVVDNV